MKTFIRLTSILVILSWIIGASPLVQAAPAIQKGGEQANPAGLELTQPGWITYTHPDTGLLRFLSVPPGEAIPHSEALEQSAPPEAAARDFLRRYGELFGVQDPDSELSVMKTSNLPGDVVGAATRAFVRFQQVYQTIPVMGGELIVQLDDHDSVLSVSGEVLPVSGLDTNPQVGADQASQIALEKVAKDYGLEPAGLTTSQPELWIYNPLLLGGPGLRLTSLVWRIEITPLELAPIRELVLVDAALGNVTLSFNQAETTRNRLTYDANNGTTLPGTLVCNESNPNCSVGDTHEAAAHIFAGATYDFYLAQHGRDSFDNAGGALISTVHYSTGYANAFWNGTQMVYGDANGFPLADDVVAHELTHGVTDRESLLFYFYQSGAISESFSDIWGELVDLYQATGNDAGDTRWDIGEDVTGLGTLRNMMNPADYNDPDKMSSTLYYCNQSTLGGSGDNGGVHYNSGVGNHAAALMVDGGSFNGFTVSALGYVKVAKVYYEAQTNLLTSAADYGNLYAAMQQACSNLGYSAADCQEVKDAMDAVEMNTQPLGCPATHAPVCDSGTPSNLFFDDIESGGGNWQAGSNSGALYWFVPQTSAPSNLLPDPYATSGVGNIWGFNQGSPLGGASDTYLAMKNNVTLPANAFLHFNHSFGFESSSSGATRYDGGILEYSTNSGSSWTNAGSLITHNGYNGTLASGNPLGAIPAFSADSRGYISSRANLSTLSGQSVRFRFRMGTDSTIYDYGWFIDDVRIYTCGTPPQVKAFLPVILRGAAAPPTLPAAPTNLQAVAISSSAINLTWNDNANNEDGYYIERSPDGSTWSGPNTLPAGTNSYPDSGLPPSTTFYYRVRAFNAVGPSTYSNTANATTQPAACQPLYADDFSNPNSGWPVGDDGNVRLEYLSGEYRVLVRPVNYWVVTRPSFQAADYNVAVDLRNPNGIFGSYGIAFGIASDWSSLYSLEIYPDGWYGLYRTDPAGFAILSEAFSPAINQGSATNHIKIERNGASIKAYANGQLLATVTDGTYVGTKYLGLISYSYANANVDIRFDNFSVYPVGCSVSNSTERQPDKWLVFPGQLIHGFNRADRGSALRHR